MTFPKGRKKGIIDIINNKLQVFVYNYNNNNPSSPFMTVASQKGRKLINQPGRRNTYINKYTIENTLPEKMCCLNICLETFRKHINVINHTLSDVNLQ